MPDHASPRATLRARTLASLALLAPAAVACSGDDGGSGASATTGDTATTSSDTSEASESGASAGETTTTSHGTATGGATETTGDTDTDTDTDTDNTDTGDTGDTGDALGPCADLRLSDADAAEPGSFAVGGFTVAVTGEGQLRATPSDRPEHAVLATPETAENPGTIAAAAAAVDLEIEEHQGSFAITQGIQARCDQPTLTRLLHGGDPDHELLILEGGFADADPACAGLHYRLRLCESAPHELAFDLEVDDPTFNRLSLRVAAAADERVFGAGEQFPHDTLNLKGRVLPILAQEGGIGRGHGVISPAVNAFSKGSAGDEGTTYYAAPHYLTTGLRSLFLENEEYAELDFREPEVDELRVYSPRLVGRALDGESPLALIEGFTRFTGRMAGLPAWVGEGAIVALARPLPESAAIIADLRDHGAEIAAVWNQTWSGVSETFIGEQVLWNWVQNPSDHPGWSDFVSDLEAQGIRTLCYVNSMLREIPPESEPVPRDLYQEALAAGYFVHREGGAPYLLEVTAFEVGLLDLANPEAHAWMKDVIIDEMIDAAGCAGWMADFAEALPFDAVMADGSDGARWHNRYPVEWIRLNREAITAAGADGELLVFNRSGHTKSPGAAMLLWEGDQLTTWDKYDGLVSALRGLISGGFSGIAVNHSDTGGYTSLSWLGLGYDREAEQLKRWTEMNAFTAVLRTHEGNQPGYNAQIYSDPAAMEHFARFTRVYRALNFYRQDLLAAAAERGWPVVRHLWLHYPEDPIAATIDDQFLLGSELLVAPIKNKCFTWPICPYNKTLYLPAGEWVHLWSGEVYGDLEAGETITIQAPIGEPAVFYRRGSPIAGELVDNLLALGIDAADPP